MQKEIEKTSPNTAPMEVSKASEEMWKGRAQLVPLKIGVVDSLFLISVNVICHASFQITLVENEKLMTKRMTKIRL